MPQDDTNLVSTSRKTIEVIRTLGQFGDAGVTELATALDMNKSTVHNHLRTLEREELIVSNDSRYQLSLRFLELGGGLRNRTRLYRLAEPETRRLADRTGELANLMTEQHSRGVYLSCSKGSQAVDISIHAGLHTPLHSTALGKSILAHLPESRIEEVIRRQGLSAETPNTITDRTELLEELNDVQEQGFALDDEEFFTGLRCVGAPIRTESREVLGAVSVSAPRNRMRDREFSDEFPDLVRSAANVIELNVSNY